MEYFLIGFLWFSAGCLLGKSLEAFRWRNNAEDVRRIESRGRLFKVYESVDDHES